MASDFSILSEFLERCGPEVSGLSLPTPAPELAAMFERFARGECSPEDRTQVCDLLQREPDYVRVLAQRVIDLRRGRNPAETEG